MIVQSHFKDKTVIVFDLDGTLVKLHAKWHALKDVLSKKYSRKYKESCTFTSISSCLSKIVERGDDDELDSNFEIIRQYELENITKTEPIVEVIYFVKNRKNLGITQNVKLAVFSLNTRETIKESLFIADIDREISFIIGREDVRKWKPEPEGLLKIMKYYKVNPNQMIFFGDLRKDIEAGNAAGVDSYYVEDLISFVEQLT